MSTCFQRSGRSEAAAQENWELEVLQTCSIFGSNGAYPVAPSCWRYRTDFVPLPRKFVQLQPNLYLAGRSSRCAPVPPVAARLGSCMEQFSLGRRFRSAARGPKPSHNPNKPAEDNSTYALTMCDPSPPKSTCRPPHGLTFASATIARKTAVGHNILVIL